MFLGFDCSYRTVRYLLARACKSHAHSNMEQYKQYETYVPRFSIGWIAPLIYSSKFLIIVQSFSVRWNFFFREYGTVLCCTITTVTSRAPESNRGWSCHALILNSQYYNIRKYVVYCVYIFIFYVSISTSLCSISDELLSTRAITVPVVCFYVSITLHQNKYPVLLNKNIQTISIHCILSFILKR